MPIICKQKISNTQNCDREEYKDGICIVHHNSQNKPSNIFRKIIRDDIYRGLYDFSYMISYDGFSFDELKIENDAKLIFRNSYFAGPFQIRNRDLKASFDFTDADFDSGLFITLSDIRHEIIIKNSNISMDLKLSLCNFDSLTVENSKINCKADFSNSYINGNAKFNHIHFKDNLIFLNAIFRDDFTFENIIVEKDADFRNAVFFKKMKFENAEFKGNFLPAEIIDNDKIELKNVLINGRLVENNQKAKEEKNKFEKIKEAKEKIYNETVLKEKEK